MNVSDIVSVVPAYNDQEGLETTLRSLDRFGLAMIVAVDDGSEPPLEAPHDLSTPFKLIRHDKNKGGAAARNTGISAISTIKSDWVYFTDCGCIHQPDIFLSYQKSWTKGYSNVSAFIGPVVATTQGRLASFYTNAGILNPVTYLSEDNILESARIVTCNALVSRAAMDTVGYFDEKMTTSAEDTDFGWRLSKVGKIVWCKYAEIAHNFTESLDDFDSRFKKYGKGTRLLSDKYNFEWTLTYLWPISSVASTMSGDVELFERKIQMLAEGFNSI